MSRSSVILYKVRNGLKEGLLTHFYTWHGDKPPEELENLTPLKKEVTPWINFVWWDSPSPGVPSEFFAVMWKGFLYIPRTGEYRFYVTTDDGSRLWINDNLVIDAWKDQPPTTYVSEPILLEAGYHRLKYYFYNRYAFAEAVLGWIPPYGEPGVIGREYFKHVDTGKIKITGLPDEYFVEIISKETIKKCIPQARECVIDLKYEEMPFKGMIRVLEKDTGRIIHETVNEIELWGGDEIKMLISQTK